MMTTEQIESLKADFLEWTGGFEPETDGDIAAYVSASMPFDFDAAEATEVLRRWRAGASVQIGRNADRR